MPALSITGTPSDLRPTATWAAALLLAIARDEAAGRRARRLTEPGLSTWQRFRGRLTSSDLVALMLEDAAAVHGFRSPFDAEALKASLPVRKLPPPITEGWLSAIQSMDLLSPSADYIIDQARLLGLPTRMARADLHVVKAHQKVLELPGTGGQLAHYIVSTQGDVTLQGNITVACGSWQESTLAGIIALDLGAPNTTFAIPIEEGSLRDPASPLRKRCEEFDFVVGLHPEKGGLYQVKDQLEIWFPAALNRHVLV